MYKYLYLTLFIPSISLAGSGDDWPEFNKNTVENIVVVGYVTKAEYLPELVDPRCGTGEFICMDPPPIKFEIEIEDTIYGKVSNKTIYAFTTSHYGKDQFEINRLQPYLFHLKTDWVKYEMPRYHFSSLAYLESGGFAIPMLHLNDTPYFLPCNVNSLNQKLDFEVASESENVLLPIEDYTKKEIEIMKRFSHISKYAVRVLRGIELGNLKNYLNKNLDKPVVFECVDE